MTVVDVRRGDQVVGAHSSRGSALAWTTTSRSFALVRLVWSAPLSLRCLAAVAEELDGLDDEARVELQTADLVVRQDGQPAVVGEPQVARVAIRFWPGDRHAPAGAPRGIRAGRPDRSGDRTGAPNATCRVSPARRLPRDCTYNAW